MIFLATTTVSILRGAATTNQWGDPVEASTVHQAGIPAALQEDTRNLYDEQAGQNRVVRLTVCRLPYGTDVQDSDRIRDERTDTTYVIDSVHTNASPVHATDVVVDLRRTT